MKNGDENNIYEKEREKTDGKKETLTEYMFNLRMLRDRYKKGGADAKTNFKFILIAILAGVVIIGGLLLYSQLRFPF